MATSPLNDQLSDELNCSKFVADTDEYCRVLLLAGGCSAVPCSDFLDVPPSPNALTVPAEVLRTNGSSELSHEPLNVKLVSQRCNVYTGYFK